jgi:tRNA(adenine34) deaminase
MPQDHEKFMRIALDEAAKAGAEGNIAVGSIIVKDGNVIARGRNLTTSTIDLTAHAEMVALREVGPALGQLDLSGSTLYTTFEPCPMCCGAIMESGVDAVVAGARFVPGKHRWGSYTIEALVELAGRTDSLQVTTRVLEKECNDIVAEWQAKQKG